MSTALRHRNLPHLMLQAREALMAQFRPILNENGVTEQQWRIVRALLSHGPLEPRQLCELCQISSPSIVGVLLRMEEAGLVDRERMAGDQRRVQVSITARSRQLGRRMIPAIEKRYADIEELVGVETLQQAYDVLDALLTPLGYVPANATDVEQIDEPASAARRRKPARQGRAKS
ncbi:MAG: homoprotocatechuate degradation operon regulator HpaR [Burkholderiales bacterium]